MNLKILMDDKNIHQLIRRRGFGETRISQPLLQHRDLPEIIDIPSSGCLLKISNVFPHPEKRRGILRDVDQTFRSHDCKATISKKGRMVRASIAGDLMVKFIKGNIGFENEF